MAEMKYYELSRAQINDHEDVVISQTTINGEYSGYSVSKCLNACVNGKNVKIFLKNGLGILTEEALINLYRAVKDTISQVGLLEEAERKEEQNKD